MPSTDWTLWQLADSAFPSGGFAHSGGLEAAYKHGLVVDQPSLEAYLESMLVQAGRQALPVIGAVLADPSRFAAADAAVEAMLLNHVQNRASRAQGRALYAAVRQAFTAEVLPVEAGHLWPVWGVVAAALEVSDPQARRLYLFTACRSQMSAAVRLGLIGPLRAQSLLHAMRNAVERTVVRSEGLGLDDLTSTAPILDLMQANQDRLYSRLFQS